MIHTRQYIIKKRLELAQLLLVNTSKKVKEISRETGFDNEKYFSRLFKAKMKITPSEYRHRLNQDKFL
ncbi:helix-turn-helix domain-containing protein [Clostridium grantii]|uniref:helix-turn-helix domain-containing protein n=1 Tax=Clostridium grantii TaxID=40575 RepID=UPI000A045149